MSPCPPVYLHVLLSTQKLRQGRQSSVFLRDAGIVRQSLAPGIEGPGIRGIQFLLQLLGVIFGDQINAHIAHWMCKNYGV